MPNHNLEPEYGEPRDEDLAGSDEPIETTEDVAALVHQLETQRDEAIEAKLRALADFRNYQRRADESEKRALQSGAVRVVRSILPVLDHFDLALSQKPEQMTVPQLLQAVKIVRDEFNKALAAQGVERIEPVPGEPFDPHQHEAVMRQPVPGAEPNSVVSTMQSGFAMGDLVLRPAKVAVAPGEEE
jgi:molecular chaperone GrpE